MRDPRPSPRHRALYDGILWVLLLGLLVGVVTFDRSRWTSMIGDEATYLMTAESLAWDLDLSYDRQDYDRFVDHWHTEPYGLILQSGDRGRHLTFGKPFFYPLYIAPFVRLSPTRGAFLGNFLLLAVAALAATGALRPMVGSKAPLWVACFLFASVVFAYVYWAHADLFLMVLVAIAYSLLSRSYRSLSSTRKRDRPRAVQWFAIGALLAVVVFSRPFYLPLLLPPLVVLPRPGRWRAAMAFVAGVAVLVLASASVHKLVADSWTSYGGQRRGFTEVTGFPAVDFPVEQWQSTLEDHGDAAWAEARSLFGLPPIAVSLWLWNSVYFLIGRHIGVLPYFLPVVLGLLGRPRGWMGWTSLAAVLAATAAFFLYRPFNIYGGGGAMANRYFLPLYPVFWFLATRPCNLRRLVAVGLLAAGFLWPLWSHPRSFPQRQNHTWRYVPELANRLLPFETTQSHLKPSGRDDLLFGSLWIKFLTPTLRAKRDRSGLLLDRGRRGELLVGSYRPVERLEMQIREAPPETLRVLSGGRVVEQEEGPAGRRLELELDGPRARHPMWWTWDPFYLYRLVLTSESTAPGRVTFTLRSLPQPRSEER